MTVDAPSLTGRAGAGAWAWRYEAAAGAFLAATAGLPLLAPPIRRWIAAYWRRAKTRRLLQVAWRETKVANASGQLPRVRRIRSTPFGERVSLRVRAGQWSEFLEVRADALAAALKASAVRITKDPQRSERLTLDVVRLDPLGTVGDILWAGHDHRGGLSIWDPIHLGRTEIGDDLVVSAVERSLLVGGIPGSGKSTLLRLVAAHAALSPDAELLLIDPNQVQFAPWRGRALAYASQDQDEALGVLMTVRLEIDRRLDLLAGLPGAPDKVTRELASAHGLPLWVLMIDELAYHTSVAEVGEKRARFAALLRDIVARGRAAGVVPVVATQRPTDRVVPRELSDLFALRVAFQVTSASNSDVILGEGWSKRGFDASRIPLSTRGVGLVLAEGERPVRFKAARIRPEQVSELAAVAAQVRPARLASVA